MTDIWKKTRSNKQRGCYHQNKQVEEKLSPSSYIYVPTTFEHQVKDKYASENVQIFYRLCSVEIYFQHQQGHQRVGALAGRKIVICNINISVNGVEHQKRVDVKKTWKTDYMIFRSYQRVISTLLAEKVDGITHKHR